MSAFDPNPLFVEFTNPRGRALLVRPDLVSAIEEIPVTDGTLIWLGRIGHEVKEPLPFVLKHLNVDRR